MTSARRRSRRTAWTIDTAGSGYPASSRRAVARLSASSSHTAAGVSARRSSSMTVPPRGSEIVPQNAGPGRPVDARLGRHGDPAVARAEEEVGVDPPAAGLRRGEARDPFRWLFGERVEHRRRAQERQAEGVGPGRGGAGDDAVILPGQGGHAQASQLIDRRRGPLRIGGGVPDHQLEWSSADPAGVIDLANGQLESGEQVPAGLDPAGPGQRNESADPDG